MEAQTRESYPRKHAIIFDGASHSGNLLTALLEEMEFGSISSVPDGEAVLHIVGNKHVDLLLIDLDSAGASGDELVKSCLRKAPELNIVVISSYATVDSSVELMKTGVVDVIRKPLDMGTVKTKLAALMKMTAPHKIAPEPSVSIGHYAVIREIERGGMGIIYKAKDTRSGETIALKVLKTGRNAPIEQVLRFHREASTISKLDHPYIVKIIDTGFSGDDYFIAMEFVDGKSLDEVVYEGEISVSQAVDVVIKCLHAMEYAHDMNVIHRDLKPPNILVDRSYNPHIIDFGLATFVKGNIRLTRTGIVMGTIGYIAPERIRGGPVDERVDVFSMGAILYESLTKKIPYETDSRVISVPTSCDELIPIRRYESDVPPELDQVCARSLSVAPESRYKTAKEFRLDLEEVRTQLTD